MVFMALFPFPFSLHAFVVAAVNHCSIATVYEATNSTISIKLAYFFIYIYFLYLSHMMAEMWSQKNQQWQKENSNRKFANNQNFYHS